MLPVQVKKNEIYTDFENHPALQKSQLEMWLHVIQIVKHGIVTGSIPIKDITSRYEIKQKQ